MDTKFLDIISKITSESGRIKKRDRLAHVINISLNCAHSTWLSLSTNDEE